MMFRRHVPKGMKIIEHRDGREQLVRCVGKPGAKLNRKANQGKFGRARYA